MNPEIIQLLGIIGGSIGILTFFGAAVANILYSKPRVEKLTAEQRVSERLIAGLQAQNAEQGAQIRVLQQGPMDAIKELAGAVSLMAENIRGDGTAIVAELREMRSAGSDEHAKLVTAIEKMGNARSRR